jgi:hypothetical protein
VAQGCDREAAARQKECCTAGCCSRLARLAPHRKNTTTSRDHRSRVGGAAGELNTSSRRHLFPSLIEIDGAGEDAAAAAAAAAHSLGGVQRRLRHGQRASPSSSTTATRSAQGQPRAPRGGSSRRELVCGRREEEEGRGTGPAAEDGPRTFQAVACCW